MVGVNDATPSVARLQMCFVPSHGVANAQLGFSVDAVVKRGLGTSLKCRFRAFLRQDPKRCARATHSTTAVDTTLYSDIDDQESRTTVVRVFSSRLNG